MPRARDNAPPASSRIPQFQQRQGAGKTGPVAALVAQQQEQQQAMTKLIQTMQQAQAENQQAVRQAAQAGGQGATQVANQVAAGLARQNQETARQQERAEDRQFAEDQQRLNAQLQRDAQKEAQAMGVAIQGQREAIMNFRESFVAKKVAKSQAIDAYQARTDEMLSAGWFSSQEGRKELAMRRHHVDAMKAMHQDHYDDRHLAEAYRLHNKGVQALIRGDDARDLSNLRVEPMMMPMADPPQNDGKRLMQPGELSGDKMFELKMHQGYPRNGVVFNQEENFGMPEGYAPKLLNSDVILDAMSRDDYLRFANDASLRQELDRKNAEIIVQSRDRLEPHLEMYENYNKMFNPMAGGAIQRSLEDFLADDNPHKFNDMGRQITFGAVKEIFGGGRKGDEVARIAAEVFDGKRELKSDKELMIAMALESAMFNIKTQMQNEFMSTDAEGSLGGTLVKQMEELLGPEQASLALGVPSNAVGFVKGVDVMMGRLAEASAFANRAHMGFEKNSLIEQFQGELGRYARLADVYAMRVLDEGTQNERRVKELMGEAEALQAGSEAIEEIAPGDLQGEFDRTSRRGLQSTMTHMDAVIALANDLGPDTMNEISAFITQELEPLTSGNLQAYIDQTRVESERSGYAANAVESAGFNHGRNQRARMKRQEGEQRQGAPSAGESFEKGGAIGVLVEQTPRMISLGAQGLQNTLASGATAAVSGVAGRGPGTAAALGGLAAFKGQMPIPLPGETEQMSNLTLAEKAQIIRESNKRN